MLKRRRNARCTAVADSVLINSRTQKFLCCLVAILLSNNTAARLALGEHSSILAMIFENIVPSLSNVVNYSHSIYSSGNIDVRN